MLTNNQPIFQTPDDPLTMGYLTQGQMGYLPAQQFLTPSEYGAFRSMPRPMPQPTQQNASMWQNYLAANRGSLLGLPAYTFGGYNPVVDQEKYRVQATRRIQDNSTAMLGSMANVGMGMSMGFGGIPGIALSMVMPDISAPLLDRIRTQRGYQNLTMSKITTGSDVSASTGQGFNARAASSLDRFIRKESADDVLLKEGDYQKALVAGMDAGLFDYADSARKYKDILKKFREQFTLITDVVGSSDFKDIFKQLKRLQDMGAKQSLHTGLLRQENMFSRMTGLSHQDMVNTYGQQGALTFSQHGLANYQGSTTAMGYAASTTLMQRLGLLTPESVARRGGVSGIAQENTRQEAAVSSKLKDFLVPALMNKDMTGIDDSKLQAFQKSVNSGTFNLTDFASKGATALGGSPENFVKYQGRSNELNTEFRDKVGGAIEQRLLMHKLAKSTGDQYNIGLEGGYRVLGFDSAYSKDEAATMSNSRARRDLTEQAERERKKLEKQSREEEANKHSPLNKLLAIFKNFGFNVWNSTYGAYAEYAQVSKQRKEDAESGYVNANAPSAGGSLPSNVGAADPTTTQPSRKGGTFARTKKSWVSDPVKNVAAFGGKAITGKAMTDTGKAFGNLGMSQEEAAAFVKDSKFAAEFKGLDAASPEFATKWQELAKNPEFTKEYQAKKVSSQWQPFIKQMEEKGLAGLLQSEEVYKDLFAQVMEEGADPVFDSLTSSITEKEADTLPMQDLVKKMYAPKIEAATDPTVKGTVTRRRDDLIKALQESAPALPTNVAVGKFSEKATSANPTKADITYMISMAAEFESGGDMAKISKPPVINGKVTDKGGKSYGSAQLISGIQTNGKTKKGLDNVGDFIRTYFAEEFKNLKVGSAQFDKKWKDMAKGDRKEEFKEKYEKYVFDNFIQPFRHKLRNTHAGAFARFADNPALLQLFTTTAINFGPNSVKNLLGHISVEDARAMSVTEFVDALTSRKKENAGGHYHAALLGKRYEKEGAATQKMLAQFEQELAQAPIVSGSEDPEVPDTELYVPPVSLAKHASRKNYVTAYNAFKQGAGVALNYGNNPEIAASFSKKQMEQTLFYANLEPALTEQLTKNELAEALKKLPMSGVALQAAAINTIKDPEDFQQDSVKKILEEVIKKENPNISTEQLNAKVKQYLEIPNISNIVYSIALNNSDELKSDLNMKVAEAKTSIKTGRANQYEKVAGGLLDDLVSDTYIGKENKEAMSEFITTDVRSINILALQQALTVRNQDEENRKSGSWFGRTPVDDATHKKQIKDIAKELGLSSTQIDEMLQTGMIDDKILAYLKENTNLSTGQLTSLLKIGEDKNTAKKFGQKEAQSIGTKAAEAVNKLEQATYVDRLYTAEELLKPYGFTIASLEDEETRQKFYGFAAQSKNKELQKFGAYLQSIDKPNSDSQDLLFQAIWQLKGSNNEVGLPTNEPKTTATSASSSSSSGIVSEKMITTMEALIDVLRQLEVTVSKKLK